jgi:hypothetical protein
MAKVTLSEGLTGMSGRLGNFIFRQQNGQTVILPHREREGQPSAAQKDRRERFGEAQAYAKAVLADPVRRDLYRQLGRERHCPPNALLVSNFLNPPAIDRVELAEFQGRAGDRIRILATDPIEVVGVTVVAHGADGLALETGPAIKAHGIWDYRCTTALAHTAVSLEVTAENRAGAKITQTIPLG